MLNLKSSNAAATAFTLLLFINNITALPTVPHPNLQSADGKLDSTTKIPVEAQLDRTPLLEKSKINVVECFNPYCKLKIPSAPSDQTKTTTMTSAGPGPTTTTAATSHGKAILHHSRSDDNDHHDHHGSSNDNNNKKKKKRDETPLIRIFPDGKFSPFTTEESQRFLLLLRQNPPKVVGADSYPPRAPESIIKAVGGRKDSKESSVYNKSRRCENNNGQWCRLPQTEEGIVLIAGPGIRACTYYKEEGKIISHIPC